MSIFLFNSLVEGGVGIACLLSGYTQFPVFMTDDGTLNGTSGVIAETAFLRTF